MTGAVNNQYLNNGPNNFNGNNQTRIIRPKPIVSYWKAGDPCYKINVWYPKLTDINIIHTKQLTDEFVDVCLKEKHRIFLHVNITGMGKTPFEPNIPTVKTTFFQLKKLIDNGFPQKQILVIVNPILPNDNGLNALQLLLKLFTEFRPLRLRFIRFTVLSYTKTEGNNFIVGNKNIAVRKSTLGIMPYLIQTKDFWHKYYDLINKYSAIISVDKGDEALIGIRELMAFNLKNEWFNPTDNSREKIINYERGNKYKPILNLLSEKRAVRCKNRCLLCPWLF